MKDLYNKEKIDEKMSGYIISYKSRISFTEIDFSFYPNMFTLRKIYARLAGIFVNNNFKFIEYVEKNKSLLDDFEFTPSGCYMINSKNSLYYYIGYSSNILDRLNTHHRSLKSLGGGDSFSFYINSCIKNKVNFEIEMGPVCLYPNYLKTFLQKHPDYKLNVGEYFILEFFTDLVGKILEQSLIHYYNPLLNSSKHPAIKNINWDDKYLTIPFTPKYKYKKVRYFVHWPDKPYWGLSLKSELYLVLRFNLDIKEVLANLGKLHHYKQCEGLRLPVIIDRIDDNKEMELIENKRMHELREYYNSIIS